MILDKHAWQAWLIIAEFHVYWRGSCTEAAWLALEHERYEAEIQVMHNEIDDVWDKLVEEAKLQKNHLVK